MWQHMMGHMPHCTKSSSVSEMHSASRESGTHVSEMYTLSFAPSASRYAIAAR